MLSQGTHTQLSMQQPRSVPGTTQQPNAPPAASAAPIGNQPGQPPALPPHSHTQRPLSSMQTPQSGQFVLGDITGRSLRGSKLTEQQTLDLIRTCIDNSRYYLSVGPVKRFWNCISEHVEERINRSYAWQSCRAKVVSLTELRLSKLEEASRNGTNRGRVQETELDRLLDQWIDIQKQRQRLVEQQEEQKKAELDREVAENSHQFCDHYLTSLGYGGNAGDGAQTTSATTNAEDRGSAQPNGLPGQQRQDDDVEMAASEPEGGATAAATPDENQAASTGFTAAASSSRRTLTTRTPGIIRHSSANRINRPSTHRMSSRVREIAEAIDKVTSSFASAEDVAETDSKIASLTQDVDNLKSAVNEIRADIANLNSKLDRILERL